MPRSTQNSKPSYYDLLQHPNSQRKRLQILERANFECENCGNRDATLHVHHSYYEKGLAPWEYPDDSLHCLCEQCHKEVQDRMTFLQREIGKLGFGADIEQLIGYVCGLNSLWKDSTVPIDVFSLECAKGVGDCFGLTADEVIAALEESTIDGDKLVELARTKLERTRRVEEAP